MVKIDRIYTRTGDDGSTGLVGGTRVPKNDLRVHAYGDVDELNAWCGMVRAKAASLEEAHPFVIYLGQIQNELFDIGAELATPGRSTRTLPQELSTRLEEWIDKCSHDLPPLRSFVLPGGSELVAMLHVARTVCRRAERSIVTLSQRDFVAPPICTYLNRLSDLFFAMSRFEMKRIGSPEILWEAEKRWEK